MSSDTAMRNRIDHLLPQSYLNGFTDPSNKGQLSVFDRTTQKWFETGTPGIAGNRGFYDYSIGSQPDQTADQAFKELEESFSPVRTDLVENGFTNWRTHLDFLLRFAQMLRVRSEFYRDEHRASSQQLKMYTIAEIIEREPGKVRIQPYKPTSSIEHETLLRNKAITDMRAEIAKGISGFEHFHWCLRYVTTPTSPIVTADNAVVASGNSPARERALQEPDTLIFFPICWRACLFGSPAKFDVDTDEFNASDQKRLCRIYFDSARRFVFSPVRIEFQ